MYFFGVSSNTSALFLAKIGESVTFNIDLLSSKLNILLMEKNPAGKKGETKRVANILSISVCIISKYFK